MPSTDDNERDRQEYLHHSFTDREEAYHAAYPNVRSPYLTSILLLLTGRHRAGFIVWALIGLLVAGLIWAIYAYVIR